ncbi:hypothetical protein RB195_021564 [Necator americanus]|uniref:MADF domain-containing protein n=1 Tax=Necator americanus TaxID=51031 RepID=A0ABR1EDQ1_NECAM
MFQEKNSPKSIKGTLAINNLCASSQFGCSSFLLHNHRKNEDKCRHNQYHISNGNRSKRFISHLWNELSRELHETWHDVAALPMGYYSAMNRRRQSDETEDAQRRNQFFPQILIEIVRGFDEKVSRTRKVSDQDRIERRSSGTVDCSKVVASCRGGA